MNNRDDFAEKTKRALAARAGWHCSFPGCSRLTIGPSEESAEGVTVVGVAAHISAAAGGPGSRRYNKDLTSKERSAIENGIWLCGTHSILIDRDEATYTVDVLKNMKREHEQRCAQEVRGGTSQGIVSELIALGGDIVLTGELTKVEDEHWSFTVKHFVIGDLNKITSFISSFGNIALQDRYILSNELGDGRTLPRAPTFSKEGGVYTLRCAVDPAFVRTPADRLGSDLALHPETGDPFVNKKGDIARVGGLDALPQKVKSMLSMQRGESLFAPDAGARFFEYFTEFRGSPWLSLLLKLDVIRLAAIPYQDLGRTYTPLQCVTRVRNVELLADAPENKKLPIRLELDVAGVGPWDRDIDVFMPSAEETEKRARQMNDDPTMRAMAELSIGAEH